MAPTTRAGTKHLRSKTTNTKRTGMGEKGRVKKARKVANDRDSTTTDKVIDTCCRLLQLPGEIRNRIYHVMEPKEPFNIHPPLLRPSKAETPQKAGSRGFLALAQTCKQLRAEYRPLWLRAFVTRIRIGDMGKFFATFYPSTTDLQYAPKLLQISWHSNEDPKSGCMHDLTSLLQLRALSPNFSLEFVPHKVAEGIYPGEEACPRHDLAFAEMSDLDDEEMEDFFDNSDLDCTCVEDEVYHEDWEIDMYDQMEDCTETLDTFILNDNEAWLEDIREHKMEVQCFYNNDTRRWTFEISFGKGSLPDLLLQGKSFNQRTWDYLKARGVIDTGQELYRRTAKVNFIVKFENTTKMKMGDKHMADLTARYEVHIEVA